MDLSTYLIAYLGKLNDQFNYSSGDLVSAVTDTLLDYGVSAESNATDTKKLYALAKVNLWRKILVDITGEYEFFADGAKYMVNQLYEHVLDQYMKACVLAAQYLPEYQIETGEIDTYEDPYKSFPPYWQRYK